MKYAVVGSGMVGGTLARKLQQLGEDVRVGARSLDDEKSESLRADGLAVVGYEEACAAAELVINALPGEAAVEVFSSMNLSGKVLLDVGNFDAAVTGPLHDTLAETLQRRHPEAAVVKALNAVNAHLMVEPALLDPPPATFVTGDDQKAVRTVVELLQRFGWVDVFVLGGLSTSRAVEQIVVLNEKLAELFDGRDFAIAVTCSRTPSWG